MEGIQALGPRRAAGIIEWSKSFARRFGEGNGLPQPIQDIPLKEGGDRILESEPDMRDSSKPRVFARARVPCLPRTIVGPWKG